MKWQGADARLQSMHWAVDLGAASFTEEFALALNCDAILARFSRLVIDLNRPLCGADETLFRRVADSLDVDMNANIDSDERMRRVEMYYRDYHEQLAALVHCNRPKLVASVHSFTDEYEGVRRDRDEIGVLYCDEADRRAAVSIVDALRQDGFAAELNVPWSGLDGYMYSAHRHAQSTGANSVMFEFRQDLCTQSAWRHQFTFE
jgi:predicted N-formylglutamate amidohydrolase